MKKKVVFKPYNQHQLNLFPLNLEEYIPKDHPVRLISKVVDQLDISNLLRTYKGGGTSSYHPRMLLKVILYAYYQNIYSSRKIAWHLRNDVSFMWLSGMQFPDFRTIANFRSKRMQGLVHEYFKQITLLLYDIGLIDLSGVSYVDGTKIEANANRYSFVWQKQVSKSKAKLELKLADLISYIESVIKGEEVNKQEKIEISEVDMEQLKEKVKELNEGLREREDLPRREKRKLETKLNHIENKYLPKLEEYREKEKKLKGRGSYSKTDEDATFMRMKEDHMKNGQLKPGYNVQISTENQMIKHYTVSQSRTDTDTLAEHIESYSRSYKTTFSTLVADPGYSSEENYTILETKGIDAYIKPQNYEQKRKRKYQRQLGLVYNMYYNEEKDYFVCAMGQHLDYVKSRYRYSKSGYRKEVRVYEAKNCQGCPLRGQCYKGKGRVKRVEVSIKMLKYIKEQEQKLSTAEGKELYSRRKIEPETVFGNIKQNKGFRRFLLRGLKNVETEFGLIAIAHNLGKLIEWLESNGIDLKEFLEKILGKNPKQAQKLIIYFLLFFACPSKKHFGKI